MFEGMLKIKNCHCERFSAKQSLQNREIASAKNASHDFSAA
jgi:hypothetical protein